MRLLKRTEDVGDGGAQGGDGVLSVLQEGGSNLLEGVQVLGQLALQGVNVGLDGGGDSSGGAGQGAGQGGHVLQHKTGATLVGFVLSKCQSKFVLLVGVCKMTETTYV